MFGHARMIRKRLKQVSEDLEFCDDDASKDVDFDDGGEDVNADNEGVNLNNGGSIS